MWTTPRPPISSLYALDSFKLIILLGQVKSLDFNQ